MYAENRIIFGWLGNRLSDLASVWRCCYGPLKD